MKTNGQNEGVQSSERHACRLFRGDLEHNGIFLIWPVSYFSITQIFSGSL
jgi:hypothetical protein